MRGNVAVSLRPDAELRGIAWNNPPFLTVFVIGSVTGQPAASLRQAVDAGAAIALASGYRTIESAVMSPQYLMHLAVARYGLSPEEAIVATTYNAACSLRMSHVIGSIEPGKVADLLVMDVPDYSELWRRPGNHDISLVVRAGKVLWRRNPVGVD